MGFRRGVQPNGKKGHRWSNNPDSSHTVCTICGCQRIQKTVGGKKVLLYYDRSGNQVESLPD